MMMSFLSRGGTGARPQEGRGLAPPPLPARLALQGHCPRKPLWPSGSLGPEWDGQGPGMKVDGKDLCIPFLPYPHPLGPRNLMWVCGGETL